MILVAGASGYIGRQLTPRLLEAGCRVRCLMREAVPPGRRLFPSQVEIVSGDILSEGVLDEGLQGISAAYYLIHSMASGRRYHERDMAAARRFIQAADRAGVEHIIYLGGLADPGGEIGRHMRSRIQTGEVLRQGRAAVTEFRAGVIIGPGSISFEMIRYLTEQFPVLIGPRWLKNRVQPVAVRDVIAYLLAALGTPESRGRVFEIGGPDVMAFGEAMLLYARLRGLQRGLVTLPWIPLRLMAFGVDRLTPVPASIAAPLIEGMRSDSLVAGDDARRVFPGIEPLGYREAVMAALSDLTPDALEPVWDIGTNAVKILKHAGFFIEFRQARLEVRPEAVYRSFARLGGTGGWLYLDTLWRLRGFLDRLAGGPGMRGRPGDDLAVGDVVDFYRVEVLEPGRRLRLWAELKAPGLGWMEWRVRPDGSGACLFSQTAYFAPKGLGGYLYWYLLYPVHHLVFAGLFRAIGRRANRLPSPKPKSFS